MRRWRGRGKCKRAEIVRGRTVAWCNLKSYCYVAGGCLLSLSLCNSGFHDLLRDRLSSLLMLSGCISKYNHSRMLLSYFTLQPMKMDLIEGSETSAILNQTPGNYPKESLRYVELHVYSPLGLRVLFCGGFSFYVGKRRGF